MISCNPRLLATTLVIGNQPVPLLQMRTLRHSEGGYLPQVTAETPQGWA